jgi:4,5:9,10-diseco-3-hydroxy-5,9,17-trioxoandrosta-1(10),2-diene-4-oate hydrolase
MSLTDTFAPVSGRRAAIGADGPVEFIEAAGVTVAVKRWGSGPPVLCLHATGHGGGDFAPLATRVGDRFEIIAIDWPGQGRSPEAPIAPSAARYADIVLGVCERLGLERPIVIGNSIGGAAALVAAHRAPTAFSALVLCNAGGLAPLDATARFVIARMVSLFDAGARGAFWFNWAFGLYYKHLVLPRGPAQTQRKRIIAAGGELAPLLAAAWRSFADPDADIRSLASGVSLPVWLAWAKGDQLVAWSRSKEATKRFSNRTVTLFPGGHTPFLETPDRFSKHFLAFAACRSSDSPESAMRGRRGAEVVEE